MNLALVALLAGLKMSSGVPVEQVHISGSGCPNEKTLVTESDWGVRLKLEDYQVGSTTSRKECELTANIDLFGGCLNEAYIKSLVLNSLPINTSGSLTVEVWVDDRPLATANKITLAGKTEPWTTELVQPIGRVCGDSVTLKIRTLLESDVNGTKGLAITTQHLDIAKIGTPPYSGVLQAHPGMFAAMILVLTGLKEMLE